MRTQVRCKTVRGQTERRRQPLGWLLWPAAPLGPGPEALRWVRAGGGAPGGPQWGAPGNHNSQAPARPSHPDHVTARPESRPRRRLNGLGTWRPSGQGCSPRAHHGGESGRRREKRTRGQAAGAGPLEPLLPAPRVARRPWQRAGEGGVLKALATARTGLGRRERWDWRWLWGFLFICPSCWMSSY